MLEDHKQLRKLQLEQYKILQSVNDLCSKYGIEYYLLYGTLLGAVRHSKFIPWDYDIDIAMERTQFNRFKSVGTLFTYRETQQSREKYSLRTF